MKEYILAIIPSLVTLVGAAIPAYFVYKANIKESIKLSKENKKEIDDLKSKKCPCEVVRELIKTVEAHRERLNKGDVAFEGVSKDIEYMKLLLEKIDKKL